MLRTYLKGIADAIRSSGVIAGELKASNFPSLIRSTQARLREQGRQTGFEQGKRIEREEFWRNLWYGTGNTLRIDYQYMFGNSWDINNFKPMYPQETISPIGGRVSAMFRFFNRGSATNSPIDLAEFCSHCDFSNVTTARELFCDARIKNVTIDLSNATDCVSLFNNGNGGTVDNVHIKITEKCANYLSAFNNASSLKTIIFTDDSVITATIDLHWSPLIKASIVSIINALSTETINATLSLKKTAVQSSFGADYDSSTEWTTLKNRKRNWTISMI